jgi:Polyketide cyclase / dehydrase and lipid transport
MKPVRVTVDVPQPRHEVYDFLDVLGNHEPFTNHMLRDWRLSGPERGVGAKAHVTATLGPRPEGVDIEVVEAEPPVRNVERNIGAGGKRVGFGTYTLTELPGGGTRVEFEYRWEQAPLGERLAAPLARAALRRGNRRAMARLAALLANERRK